MGERRTGTGQVPAASEGWSLGHRHRKVAPRANAYSALLEDVRNHGVGVAVTHPVVILQMCHQFAMPGGRREWTSDC